MKIVDLYDSLSTPMLKMRAMLCGVYKEVQGKECFVFYTAVRSDGQPPVEGFYEDRCTIYDLDVADGGGTAYVFHNSSSPSILAIRGKSISREQRLLLLLGRTIDFEGYTIRPA